MVFTEHVKIREEKFGAVVFETLKEKVFVTNETGKDILNLLEDGDSVGEIVDTLAHSYYGVQSEEIRDDIVSFINQLRDNGIIAKSIEHRA